MRVLITGGAGFIGSHLCEHLLGHGAEVICMDNLMTGSLDNVAPLFGKAGFRFVHYNVSNFLWVDGTLDCLMHFASPASPVDYLKYPIQTLKVGSLGTLNALGLAKAKNAVFLLASTSEVYGDPHVSPQPEDYWGNVNPVGPRGVYDEAKRFAEAMTMAYHRYHGMQVRIARIFNTYGPRMRENDGRAIPNFIVQALRGLPLTVYGDGSQTRSFCFVTDLVEGIYTLMTSRVNEPVNLGNPAEMTIRQLADAVLRIVGSRSQIEFRPLPEDDPKIRRPDIAKAHRLLHWQPQTSLDEGLERTVEFFRRRLSAD